MNQDSQAWCPICKYFGLDCHVDVEEWGLPCDAFEERRTDETKSFVHPLTTAIYTLAATLWTATRDTTKGGSRRTEDVDVQGPDVPE